MRRSTPTRAAVTTSKVVLAICGHSGAGKTTLIEALVPQLCALGWQLAVVKRTRHEVALDVRGKDSDRLFRAGASVGFVAYDQTMVRSHGDGGTGRLIDHLATRHDLVLVEGHKESPLPKLWLLSAGEDAPPAGLTGILGVLDRSEGRLASARALVIDHARRAWRSRPLRAAIVLGQAAEAVAVARHALGDLGPGAIVIGTGPGCDLRPAPSFADHAAACVVAAMRWDPEAAWLVLAADTRPTTEAIARVLEQRKVGAWQIADAARPTVTMYEPQALEALEARRALASPPG